MHSQRRVIDRSLDRMRAYLVVGHGSCSATGRVSNVGPSAHSGTPHRSGLAGHGEPDHEIEAHRRAPRPVHGSAGKKKSASFFPTSAGPMPEESIRRNEEYRTLECLGSARTSVNIAGDRETGRRGWTGRDTGGLGGCVCNQWGIV